MLIIEPVRPADRERALALLAGEGTSAGLGWSAAAFSTLLSGRDAKRCRLWWAKAPIGPSAAAMTVRNPGRTAMIFYSSPAGADGIDTLARLLDKLTEATVTKEVAFVLALPPSGVEVDAAAFAQAGYSHLAQLIYMQRPLADLPEEAAAGLEWKAFSPGREDELADVIADTYVESADCSDLLGLRRIEDVVAGHKAAGVFRPENWFLPAWKGDCVGCVLVNDPAERDRTAEVVYLGVRPRYRRRGFARAMLRHAMGRAKRRGMKKISLAVDAANTPAVRLYRREGFAQTERREVFIRSSRE